MPVTPTQARSSANVLAAAGNAARALWDVLRGQAVSAQPDALTFADGSTLRYIPASSTYVAL